MISGLDSLAFSFVPKIAFNQLISSRYLNLVITEKVEEVEKISFRDFLSKLFSEGQGSV